MVGVVGVLVLMVYYMGCVAVIVQLARGMWVVSGVGCVVQGGTFVVWVKV